MWLVDPKLWDDGKFLKLNGTGRLCWLFILTGTLRTSLPGLIASFDAFALASAMRYEPTECTFALRSILDLEMAEYDPDVRVLRVPNAPKYAICRNPNILAGWYRLWNHIPHCALKFNHIDSLADAVNFSNQSMVERWDRTFGHVQNRLRAPQTAEQPSKSLPSVSLLERMAEPIVVAPRGEISHPHQGVSAPPPVPGFEDSSSPLPTNCFKPAVRKREY